MTNLFGIALVILAIASAQEWRKSTIILGESITLYCPVHVKGEDFTIKSITWTKDGKAFYKYIPSISDYPYTFDVDGVQIEDDTHFNGTTIIIGPATPQTAGLYRCNAELNHPYIRGFKMSLNVDTELTIPFSKQTLNRF